MATEKYIGQKCISCKEVLKKDDDIVICPDCGSPYHRECYKAEGKCLNTHLHETGEEWKPETVHHVHAAPVNPIAGEISTAPITDVNIPEINKANDESGFASYQEEYTNRYCQTCGNEVKADDAFCSKCGSKIGDNTSQRRVCPACQLENSGNNVFCARCGTPLDMEKATAQGGFYGSPFAGFQRIKPESDIDGNTVEEYSSYVGNKFFSFIPKFLKFSKQGSKLSVNLWAFIFPHFYFFYRKMNGIGIASLIITILLSVPSVFDYLATMGLISTAIIDNEMFLTIAMVFYVLSMLFKFACGVFADWLYYSKAKKDIEKIKRETSNSQARKLAISSKGGTSWVGVLVASTVMVIVNIAIMIAISAFAVMM